MRGYQRRVHYYETDKMSVTHHANYIHWMEEARIDFLDQIGWSFDRMEAMGIISPVTYVDCRYRQSTTFADAVEVTVHVEEFRGVRLKLRYEMRKPDGTVVCEAHSEHCFMHADGSLMRLNREHPELYETLTALAEEKK